MSDIVVKVDGVEYHMSSQEYQNLDFVDGYLVNTSNHSFNLTHKYSYDIDTYPYIRCNSESICYIRQRSNSERQAVTSDIVYTGNIFPVLNYDYITAFLLLFMLGFSLIFKRC